MMVTTASLLGYCCSSSSSSSPSSRLCQKWGPSQIHRSTNSPLSLRSRPPQRRRRSSFFHPRAMVMLTTNHSNSTTSSSTSRAYERLESCVVVPPPSPIRPRAILMFLGGAFIGAIPECTYCYFMEMLAREAFLVVSVPYNVNFDHSKVAGEIFQRFNYCLDLLLSTGFSCGNVSIKASDLAGLPVFSVGHSNGALLQLLIGSCFSERLPKANAVVSFNNRPASEAVPYFDQLGPVYGQMVPIVEASPLYSVATSASGDALKILQDSATVLGQTYDPEAVVSFNKFVDQVPSVFNQVREGVSEFSPTPGENQGTFAKSYNVMNTLLVKFSSDTIDDTDLVEEVLQPCVKSFGGILEKITLSGNHLTPCVQDLKWQVGRSYTPMDAIVQGLKSISLIETKALSKAIADWLNQFITNE